MISARAAHHEPPVTSYDEYLRRYLPAEWERRRRETDPAGWAYDLGQRAIRDAVAGVTEVAT